MGERLVWGNDILLSGHSAKVYFDSGNREYIVRWYVKGKHRRASDYFTDDKADAISTATAMLRVQEEKNSKKRPTKKNPVPLSKRAQADAAAHLYEQFTGHDAVDEFSIDKPTIPDVLLAVGEIDGIMYSTIRDGVAEKYIHKFKKSCRPIFAVSHDGKQLFMVGGSYTFTDRGIVDATTSRRR